MLPVKLLSAIIENKDKTFLSFNKINSDTILIKMADDSNVTVSHPDLDQIKKIRVHPDFKSTIQVVIDQYFYDINYSYDPVRVTKKHKDVKLYSDLYQIGEIISDNDLKNIKISDNLITFVFQNNNQIEYLIKKYNFKLLDSSVRKQDVILQFTSGIYSVIKHQNNFHLFKLSEPKVKFENKILGYTFDQIEQQCNQLPAENCINTTLSTEYKDKTVTYNTKNFCRVKQDKCVSLENLEEMSFSYLDFDY